jgi:hypothetical protein
MNFPLCYDLNTLCKYARGNLQRTPLKLHNLLTWWHLNIFISSAAWTPSWHLCGNDRNIVQFVNSLFWIVCNKTNKCSGSSGFLINKFKILPRHVSEYVCHHQGVVSAPYATQAMFCVMGVCGLWLAWCGQLLWNPLLARESLSWPLPEPEFSLSCSPWTATNMNLY